MAGSWDSGSTGLCVVRCCGAEGFGRGLRHGWSGARLLLADQDQEVGLKPCAIFGGVAQQDLDQTAFACAEMPLNTSARKTV